MFKVSKKEELPNLIAAAIKFHIDKTDKDVVLCAARHTDIYMQLKNLGFMPREGYKEISQGFIDNNSKYYTREKLTKILGKEKVFSEDFW